MKKEESHQANLYEVSIDSICALCHNTLFVLIVTKEIKTLQVVRFVKIL